MIAHRGAAAEAPENTMPAFALGLEQGADGLELDVRRTADGELVVIHDATLDRTTDGRGRVAELTFREVRGADAGTSSVHGARATREPTPVPALHEVFERYPEVEITVDVKDVAATADVVALIRDFGRLARTILYVEEGTRRRAFREYPGRRATSTRQAVRLAGRRRWVRDPGDRSVPEVIHTPLRHGDLPIVTPEYVARAHDAGRTIQVWTINDPPEMSRLAGWEVDGIITDEVRAAVARLRSGARDVA
ncbi:MAG: glycerophosphodiester phosphodiesterase family protein [Gemmatimonadota bacterium]